jgi:hypothetical protein
MAGNGRRQPAQSPASTCRACTARLAGAVGKMSRPPGRVPSARKPDPPPRSRPSRTPNWVRPGSRKAKHPTGSAAGTPRGLSDRDHPGRRPAAHRRRRRAEGSHRGLDLGLRAWQGILAGRAPRADGRYGARRGVEIPGQRACEKPGHMNLRGCQLGLGRLHWIPASRRRKPMRLSAQCVTRD